MLTSDGTNRWFDKHQAVVQKDGTIGLNFEHSFSDGTTWNRMVHEVHRHVCVSACATVLCNGMCSYCVPVLVRACAYICVDTRACTCVRVSVVTVCVCVCKHEHGSCLRVRRRVQVWHDMESGGETSAFGRMPLLATCAGGDAQKLHWNLPADLVEAAHGATASFQSTVDNLDMKTLVFADFGKTVVKQMKMSPDALCQIAFQTSFVKLHGKSAPTYESCSTRGFFRGRTETIRTCSDAMHAVAHAMNDPAASADKSHLRELMYTAAGRHVALAKEAVQVGHIVGVHNTGGMFERVWLPCNTLK